MREDFEAWAKSRGMNVQKSRSGSYYHIVATDNAWRAWQASRQALVVELPPQHEVAYRAYDSVEIRYALTDAGIKWTE